MFQLSSQFFKEGHPNRKELVARIYFPTNRTSLDPGDKAVLDKVAEKYRTLARNHRVTLTCTGFADHRGAAWYNRRLGRKRARAVQAHLDARLSALPLCRSMPALSNGEDEALQAASDRSALAADRRVDVITSFVPHVIQGPPINVTGQAPEMWRTTQRNFSGHKATNDGLPASPSPSTPTVADSVLDLVGMGINALLGSTEFGFRRKHPFEREHVQEMRSASFDINRIKVTTDTTVIRVSPAITEIYTATIDYEWGPPEPMVRIETQNSHRDTFFDHWESKIETRLMLRREAQEFWFYNL
ncbi:MAG: OmpA family protein [Pseudomonadota bacterium]